MASFLSPCVLSLVPVYITYLGGRAVTATGAEMDSNRAQTFLHGVAFVLGFSFVFVFAFFILRYEMLSISEKTQWSFVLDVIVSLNISFTTF